MVRWLVAIGLVLVLVGLMWPLLSKLGLGRLPGDIVIERGNVRFYFPIATCLIISLVLSFFPLVAEPLKRPAHRSTISASGRLEGTGFCGGSNAGADREGRVRGGLIRAG